MYTCSGSDSLFTLDNLWFNYKEQLQPRVPCGHARKFLAKFRVKVCHPRFKMLPLAALMFMKMISLATQNSDNSAKRLPSLDQNHLNFGFLCGNYQNLTFH